MAFSVIVLQSSLAAVTWGAATRSRPRWDWAKRKELYKYPRIRRTEPNAPSHRRAWAMGTS